MPQPEIIEYRQTPQTALHLHIFRPAGTPPANGWPAICWFFCGGWKGFDYRKLYAHSQYFASRGILCLNVGVRVEQHGCGPAEALADARYALRYLRAHAADLDVDPDRIAAGGGSAAGHISASLAAVETVPDEGDPAISCAPDALVLYCPALDIEATPRRQEIFGGRERARALSPCAHVRPGLPPALIVHTRDDQVCTLAEPERYQTLMREAGNDCELVLYDAGGHGFFNFRDGRNPLCTASMRDTDRFFQRLGWLNGPERSAEFRDQLGLAEQWADIQAQQALRSD